MNKAYKYGVSRETTPYLYPVSHLSKSFLFILNNRLLIVKYQHCLLCQPLHFFPICFELMHHRPASRVSSLLFGLNFPFLWDVMLRRGSFPDVSKERPINADWNSRFNFCGNF